MKSLPVKFFCVVLSMIMLLGSIAAPGFAASGPQEKDLAYANIEFIEDQTYTGSAITPGVTVVYGGVTLREGEDYELSYSDNVELGTATATISGLGEYSGTRTAVFTIGRMDISDAVVKGLSNWIFDTSAVEYTQDLSLTLDGNTLAEGVDYELWYYGNTDLGSAAVAIVGIGGYCGRIIKTFSVVHGASSGISVPLSYADRSKSNSLVVNGTVSFKMCNLNTEGMTSSYTVKNSSGSTVESKSISVCEPSDSGTTIGTWTPDKPGTYTVTYVISGYTARVSGGKYYYYPTSGGTSYTQTIVVSDYPAYSSGNVITIEFDRYEEADLRTLYVKMDAVVSSYNTDSTILWASTDSDVATVDDYGKVTIHKPGSTTIIAFSLDDVSIDSKLELSIEPIELEKTVTGINLYRVGSSYKTKLCSTKGTLIDGTDYTVAYAESGNTVTVTVSGCGLFTGELEYKFTRPMAENFSATLMKTGDFIVEVAPGSYRESAQIVAASYTEDGRLLDLHSEYVSTLNEGFSKPIYLEKDIKGSYKVFFLDGTDRFPIEEAAESICVVMPTAEEREEVCNFLKEYITANGTQSSSTIYKCGFTYGGFSINLWYYTDDEDFNISCSPSTGNKAYAFNMRISADGVPSSYCSVQRNDYTSGTTIVFGNFYTNCIYYIKNDPVELYSYYTYQGKELDEAGAEELEQECAVYYANMLTVFSKFLEQNGYSIKDLGFCCF